ncbi:hypothetical protein FQR65_LT08000 [Abscondita terminalis]|nr:hypothetical protein FQR65_LT08000 [Abscondita terminalis]
MPVTRHQRAGGAGAPTAGGVRARHFAARIRVGPTVQDGLHPLPGGLLFVGAHEQVQPAGDHIEQQALVGAHAVAAEALVEVQIQLHRCQHLHAVCARLALARGHQVQAQAVARLQVDDQAVGRAQRRAVDGMRHLAKVHHDRSLAPRQPLAGADEKGHTGPAPVADLGAQRNEGLRLAAGGHAGFLAVAGHVAAAELAGTVLAAHHVAVDALGRPALERAQHLELFVADRIGVGTHRRLHADGAQQLQRMVLHHVAQRAGLVIEGAALLHAQALGDGDLDVGNGLAPPQRLEQRVAEAHRQQVLHRGLAQVMVYAEDLPFVEHLAHGGIDAAVGGQIVAQGLFEHHAGVGRGQACGAQLLAGLGKQRGRGGQVHHHGIGLARTQQLAQCGVIGTACQIHALVVQQLGEGGEFRVAGALVAFDQGQTRANQRAVLVMVHRVARHADDAAVRRQAPMPERLEQRRQQLAPGQVAGSAKQHQIKAHEIPEKFRCRQSILRDHAMTQLDALKALTTVVADTGDFHQLAQYQPQDATTNPSLILKAVQKPEYAPLLAQTVERCRGKALDETMDRLLVRFGCEILSIIPGRVSTEVDVRLSFDTAASVARAERIVALYRAEGVAVERVLIKAVACGQAKVQLISPFVGRIYDWYKKQAGSNWDEAAMAGANDPGVQSVSAIYHYYKHFGIATEVMGASFRNAGQILALAGCDLLTIAPELLAQLAASEQPVPQRLSTDAARQLQLERVQYDEASFRYALNEDAMATEKLAEGIRAFAADAAKLDKLLQAA